MIIICVFFGLLVASSCANITCAATQYFNSNLSLCLNCPTGCSACCDEAVCSGCITGTPPATQDTPWPQRVAPVCSVPSTATPATRTTPVSPAPITPIPSMGYAWDVPPDVVHVQTPIPAPYAAMDTTPSPLPSVKPVPQDARRAPSPLLTPVLGVWAATTSTAATSALHALLHAVIAPLVDALPACRLSSSQAVAVSPVPTTASPAETPLSAVSVSLALSFPKVPASAVPATATHASILPSALSAVPITQ
jgi:hypothetical protein